jgi:REP element-mobilizing transposase RayT
MPLQRHSLRLAHYDYIRAGAYFITLCAFRRELLFGAIAGGEVRLSAAGQIAAEEWERSAEIRAEIELDAWVVMPNHLHGIVVITDSSAGAHGDGTAGDMPSVGADGRPPTATIAQPCGAHGRASIDIPPSVGAHGRATPGLPPSVGATGRSPLQRPRGPEKRSLGAFVAGFKSAATQRINESRRAPGLPVWQRNYYEHVIRNEQDLARIRAYIAGNPARWAEDENNPERR